MNSFIFFFMINEATRYTRNQSYKQHKGNTMEFIVFTNHIVNQLCYGEKYVC